VPPYFSLMAYVPTNWQDGVTPVNAANLNKLEQGLAAAVGIPADVVVAPASALLIRNRLNAADTQPAFRLGADGKQEFGPGGSTAPDTILYRNAAASLRMNSDLYVEKALVVDFAGAGAKVYFGSALDTNLYRSAAGALTTDGHFFTGGQIKATGQIISMSTLAQQIALASDGKLYFGSAADTNLYRSAAGVLKTDGLLDVGQYLRLNSLAAGNYTLIARATGDTQYRFILDNTGKLNWGDGAAAADTYLYRNSAGSLMTNAFLYFHGAQVDNYIQQPGLALGAWFLVSSTSGDSGNRFILENTGRMSWGSGAAGGNDTFLYRSAAGVLKTDGQLVALGYVAAGAGGVAGSGAFIANAAGDTVNRLFIDNAGTIQWGPGNAALDTSLYRVSAGVLQFNGTQLFVNAASGIKFSDASVQTTAAVPGTSVLNRLAAPVLIASSNVENTVYTFSIPAGAMGTNKMVRLRLLGDMLNNSGGNVIRTYRYKIGGTTIVQYAVTNGTTTDRYAWETEVDFANVNGLANSNFLVVRTSAPRGALPVGVGGSNQGGGTNEALTGASSGLLAVNTAAAVTISVTVQMDVSNANAQFRLYYAVLELI